MRLYKPFDPIEPGETDNFAIDFGPDMGGDSFAASSPTTWSCALAPYQTATDPSPSSRILSVSTATTIEAADPVSGQLLTKSGMFSIASIGTMPATADGGTYVLEATVNTLSGRVLKLSATVLCSQTAGPN